MNSAMMILNSLEKTASRGLVMAALEAATGATVGGALGVSHARKGRSGEPLGTSDVSGAAYGAVMGALAGAGAAALVRSTAVQRGVKADMRLKSMAEHATSIQNSADIAKANLENWNSSAVRDLLYGNHFGGTHTQARAARETAQEMMHSAQQQRNQIKTYMRQHGYPPKGDPMYQMRADLDAQITDAKLTVKGLTQQLDEISKIEAAQKKSAKGMMEEIAEAAKKRRADLDAYARIVREREKLMAQSRFFGVF